MEYQQIVKIVTESALIESHNPIVRQYQSILESVLFVTKPLKVITGLRRAGKSFLVKQLYQILLQHNIPKENILLINFESDLILNYLTIYHLRNIYETFLRYANTEKPFYLLLDEIQNIRHWEQFVRTIYDGTNHGIFITGSNSRLLSQEFSTVLGGRLLQFEIYPFSFQEMLDYYQIKYDIPFIRAANEGKIKKTLDQYLAFGGLPETFDLPDNLKLNYRRSTIEKIIVNDILKRFEIQSTELLYRILQYLEKNIGTIVSFNNLAHASQADDKTIANYILYLTQTYLIMPLLKFSLKTKQLLNTQKKYYFIDNLFINLADIEDRLENTIFLHLVRRYGQRQLYFGRDDRGHEIDFIVLKKEGKISAIQACYQLTDSNLSRETRSLLRFREINKDKEISANLIYMHDARTVQNPPPDINIQNISDFLLSP